MFNLLSTKCLPISINRQNDRRYSITNDSICYCILPDLQEFQCAIQADGFDKSLCIYMLAGNAQTKEKQTVFRSV
jgi:hypothetical protein